MTDNIINSFIFKDKNAEKDIYNYIKFRYDKSIEINNVKNELSKLIKNNIIFLHNDNHYILSKIGNVVLNDNVYYYSRIIVSFFKKYNSIHNKKYKLTEIREEQQRFRKFLIENKKPKCIICDKKLPLCLLETAHIKPRFLLKFNEINDINIVELMCRYCHKIYDDGLLSICDGLLQVSNILNTYDLNYNENKFIYSYTLENKKYFNFHYKYIYRYN